MVLATGVLVLPEHQALPLAKRLATIDVLSGGRLRLGVGVGWMREEFESVGIDFDDRGARTDELIQALRADLGVGRGQLQRSPRAASTG